MIEKEEKSGVRGTREKKKTKFFFHSTRNVTLLYYY